jgi:hypothetical protein
MMDFLGEAVGEEGVEDVKIEGGTKAFDSGADIAKSRSIEPSRFDDSRDSNVAVRSSGEFRILGQEHQ